MCTHVTAVLFFLETSTRLQSKTTCTQEKCQWVIPSYQKNIPYAPVKDLDFTSAKGRKKKIDCVLADPIPTVAKRQRKPLAISSLIDSEIEKFYKTLSEGVSRQYYQSFFLMPMTSVPKRPSQTSHNLCMNFIKKSI